MSTLSILLKQLTGAKKVAAPVAKVAKKAVPLKSDIAIQDAQRAALGAHLRQMAIDNPHLFKYGKDPISLESIGVYSGLRDSPAGAMVSFGGAPTEEMMEFLKWANGRKGTLFDTMGVDKKIPGSQLYQALWNDVADQGMVNYSDLLTPVNQVRRTDNMLSRGLRDAMEGKDVLGSVWLGKSQAKEMGMSANDFANLHPDERLGALADLSRLNISADRLGSGAYDAFYKNPTMANAVEQSNKLHARLKGMDAAAAEWNASRAFGPSTLMRGKLVDDFLSKGTTDIPETPVFYKRGGLTQLRR
jgi:hypothetical protein